MAQGNKQSSEVVPLSKIAGRYGGLPIHFKVYVVAIGAVVLGAAVMAKAAEKTPNLYNFLTAKV